MTKTWNGRVWRRGTWSTVIEGFNTLAGDHVFPSVARQPTLTLKCNEFREATSEVSPLEIIWGSFFSSPPDILEVGFCILSKRTWPGSFGTSWIPWAHRCPSSPTRSAASGASACCTTNASSWCHGDAVAVRHDLAIHPIPSGNQTWLETPRTKRDNSEYYIYIIIHIYIYKYIYTHFLYV